MEVRKVLDKNKAERHIRGGMATKLKYIHEKESSEKIRRAFQIKNKVKKIINFRRFLLKFQEKFGTKTIKFQKGN